MDLYPEGCGFESRRRLKKQCTSTLGQSPAHPRLEEGGPAGLGIVQGEVILCAGEMIAEELAIESPKPPREIRSNCFTSRPAYDPALH